jgi:hypothetical protein
MINEITNHPCYPLYVTYNNWENKKHISMQQCKNCGAQTERVLKLQIRSVEQVAEKLQGYQNLIDNGMDIPCTTVLYAK